MKKEGLFIVNIVVLSTILICQLFVYYDVNKDSLHSGPVQLPFELSLQVRVQLPLEIEANLLDQNVYEL